MSLRLAAQTILCEGEKNITEGTEKLKDSMEAKLIEIAKTAAGSGGLAPVAIAVTVQALGVAYSSIEASKAARLNDIYLYKQAREAGTAFFFVPQHPNACGDTLSIGEYLHESCIREQNFFPVITKYLRDKDPILIKFANIHIMENAVFAAAKGTSFSIISYANLFLSNAYENKPGDARILEAAKHCCDLFIKTKLPSMLASITDKHTDLRKWLWSRSYYQRLYFVRFLTIAFGNILMSLQHPPNLDIQYTIKLCGQIISVINDILLSPSFRFIRQFMLFSTEFKHYLTSMRREVESLQQGYKSKILNEISLFEVVGKCHGILQGMNFLWHEILFKNSENSQPDQLLYIVRCITFTVHMFDPPGRKRVDEQIILWIISSRRSL